MKAKLLAAVSVGALIVSGTAHAADLHIPTKAPVVTAPVFSWTGCYVGAHGGWGWARPDVAEFNTSFGVTYSNGLDAHGGLGGVQVGCNYQFSPNWVVGIQGDIAAADIQGSTIVDPFGSRVDMRVDFYCERYRPHRCHSLE